MTGFTLTPESVTAWTVASGGAIAVLIKLLTWTFEERARRQVTRRAEFADILARQVEEITRLRADLTEHDAEAERRLAAMEGRVRDAERDRAMAEGILYRMGWSRPLGGTQWLPPPSTPP